MQWLSKAYSILLLGIFTIAMLHGSVPHVHHAHDEATEIAHHNHQHSNEHSHQHNNDQHPDEKHSEGWLGLILGTHSHCNQAQQDIVSMVSVSAEKSVEDNVLDVFSAVEKSNFSVGLPAKENTFAKHFGQFIPKDPHLLFPSLRGPPVLV